MPRKPGTPLPPAAKERIRLNQRRRRAEHRQLVQSLLRQRRLPPPSLSHVGAGASDAPAVDGVAEDCAPAIDAATARAIQTASTAVQRENSALRRLLSTRCGLGEDDVGRWLRGEEEEVRQCNSAGKRHRCDLTEIEVGLQAASGDGSAGSGVGSAHPAVERASAEGPSGTSTVAAGAADAVSSPAVDEPGAAVCRDVRGPSAPTSPPPSAGETACDAAARLVADVSRREDLTAVLKDLGCRRAEEGGEGCVVRNTTIFRVLDEVT